MNCPGVHSWGGAGLGFACRSVWFKSQCSGTSVAVEWLRLHAATAGLDPWLVNEELTCQRAQLKKKASRGLSLGPRGPAVPKLGLLFLLFQPLR